MELHNRTLGQWLEHWAETTPDKEYIVYSDRDLRFTWSEFNKRVDDMAKGMLAIGITHGTHVGVWATNVPDWLTFLYAGAKIGAVLVTINTNYKQSELEYLVENADIHTMCITDGVFDSRKRKTRIKHTRSTFWSASIRLRTQRQNKNYRGRKGMCFSVLSAFLF